LETDVKSWHCPVCKREWNTADHVVSMFHACTQPGRPKDLSRVGALPPTIEERRALFFQLIDVTGEDPTRGEGAAMKKSCVAVDQPPQLSLPNVFRERGEVERASTGLIGFVPLSTRPLRGFTNRGVYEF
jgi:hypothetical protein